MLFLGKFLLRRHINSTIHVSNCIPILISKFDSYKNYYFIQYVVAFCDELAENEFFLLSISKALQGSHEYICRKPFELDSFFVLNQFSSHSVIKEWGYYVRQ